MENTKFLDKILSGLEKSIQECEKFTDHLARQGRTSEIMRISSIISTDPDPKPRNTPRKKSPKPTEEICDCHGLRKRKRRGRHPNFPFCENT